MVRCLGEHHMSTSPPDNAWRHLRKSAHTHSDGTDAEGYRTNVPPAQTLKLLCCMLRHDMFLKDDTLSL